MPFVGRSTSWTARCSCSRASTAIYAVMIRRVSGTRREVATIFPVVVLLTWASVCASTHDETYAAQVTLAGTGPASEVGSGHIALQFDGRDPVGWIRVEEEARQT